jgi:D-alanyl-D-alanine carboxypeptidase/D-alanyl-D-alanine-endopeptidase (penicillin-binding protein 4)
MIQNEVKTGPEGSGDGACIYGTEFSFQQFMRGTIPLGVDEFTIKGAMPDAGIVCAELLARELQSRNVTIDKKNLELGHRTKFYTSFSPLLKEIIYWANQKSVNLYAEHLLKKIGEKTFQEGTTEAGIKAITNFWRSQNIDLAGFHMADGSGLSRKNLVTAKQFVEILLKMKGSPFFPDFFESLPQNTMAIKAKSGSMSLIRGYVGYSGEIAFAIIVNHCSNSVLMKEKLNSMLSHLSQLNEDLEN